jgi:PIN domain nuclease of toxin-antitoxin system
MTTYALDASAVLRYLDNEAGADRVQEIIAGHLDGSGKVAVLAIHWGEIAGCVYKNYGSNMLAIVMSRLAGFHFDLIPISADRAVRAAVLKADKRIPYVDAFGVEFAASSPDHVFVTADFDLKAGDGEARIEFLPRK